MRATAAGDDDRHHFERTKGHLMELIVALLVPLPLGYVVRDRLTAVVVYIAVHGFVFTYQTLELIRAWVGGSDAAFPRDPATSAWPYALVNAVIFTAGLGLVALGHRLGTRRRAKATRAVELAR
jgi:hypothetical protein